MLGYRFSWERLLEIFWGRWIRGRCSGRVSVLILYFYLVTGGCLAFI